MKAGQLGSTPVLTEDIWRLLFTQAFLFATKYINRLRWRGSYGGVLPDGLDAESIADQAVTELLQEDGAYRSIIPLMQSSHVPSAQHSLTRLLPRPISSKLSRLVWRQVDRLHHRAENFLVRNEHDLAPVHLDDGETCSFIETIPDPGDSPYDNIVRKETDAEFEALQSQFIRFLGRERHLKSLYTCYSNGIWQPRRIADSLHLSVPVTKNLQKRLKRRLRQFLEQSHCE